MSAVTNLSTGLFYDRGASAMTALTARADTLNTQISTEKRLSSASDDVVAYQRLQTLARGKADDTAYGGNIATAQSLLQQTDTTLTSITSQLQHASELALQAKNGTLSDANRTSIADALGGIVDTLVSLANTRDARGQALFGGTADGDAVTGSGAAHALAATTTASIPIGDGQSVQPTETAARVFALPGGGNTIDMLARLTAALKAGGDTSAALGSAITSLTDATTQVASVQGSVGARAARVDLAASQLKDAAADREVSRSALEDTDVTAAITDLQKTMTVLQATQASFTKLSSLSLFDYLK